MKTAIYSGIDSLKKLEKIDKQKVYIVCDPFLAESESLKKIINHLGKDNEIHVFSDVIPDPPIEKVAIGLEKMIKFNPDVVIGIGGGSAIDEAKAISFMYKYLKQEVKKITFIAIPTTSGTGSEVTSVFVLSDTKEQRKYPIIDKSITPDIAILDETLVASCPTSVTAHSGIDVLTHAFEALVAKDANNYTDALAEKAASLVWENLKECFECGTNLTARKNMHEASCLAGLAFNQAGLGICHAISHQIGAVFKLPHGLANGILLPHVIEYNAQKSDLARKKYAYLSKKVFISNKNVSDTVAVRMLIKQLKFFMQELNLAQTLRQAGISREEINIATDKIILDAMQDMTFPSNPVLPDKKELKKIYLNAI